MALAYAATVPTPPGLPEHLFVRVYVMRRDEAELSANDLRALAAMYPPIDAEGRATVDASITRAERRAKRPPSKRAKPSTAKRPTGKAIPKRKAAKRP